ncbi:MAG: metalloenzyme domain-containing protein, partial [Chloroflexi bacterium]|nr:metalloenzyme domain-containing protein [Chloroflexota bacterium]
MTHPATSDPVSRPPRFVHIFFMDGVGLGSDDPAINPFASAHLPNLTQLLGEKWYVRPESGGPGRITTGRASMVATDPNLGVPGRPQSATGQAAILTGRNVPQLVGEHYGPKPNQAVAAIVEAGNLFQEVVAAGGTAALITPYPQRYFDSVNSGKRLLSSVPLAATSAGLPLMTAGDLRAGRAVSPDFTGRGWRDYLGYNDTPLLSLEEAGRQIARIAGAYTFSFFEHWPSDHSGHRGSLDEAARHLEAIDQTLGGLLDAWDNAAGLLIITSDHGNIEEKNHSQHSRNPVPTILVGQDHARLAG